MLAQRFDTIVALMTEQEARTAVAQINGHMNSARSLLLDLYERRGWAALGYASWRECVVAEFGKAQRTLYEELEAARIEARICGTPQNELIPTSQLLPLNKLTPMEQPIAWDEANARTEGKPTARVVEEVVREMRGDTPAEDRQCPYCGNIYHAPLNGGVTTCHRCGQLHAYSGPRDTTKYGPLTDPVNDTLDPPIELPQAVDLREAERAPRINAGMFSSATPEWYTPRHIVDRVEAVFGTIDLDPCSNSHDWREAAVPAETYYTKDDNGLSQPWHGRVYMNPPYGDEIGAWVERMVNAKQSNEIIAAIALLPFRPDTAWFQPLFDHLFCCVRGRLKFSGAENSAPFPSVVVYLGDDRTLFNDWFHSIGPIVERIRL